MLSMQNLHDPVTIRKDKLGSPYADIYRNKCDESESCKLYLWLQMKK